ncbi:16S rRNA (cytosine(1402)-N(4))-methyltransferase RsmH [Leptolyngbya sp. AN02str]|uniref:16S rRNA (cytosine(1402)-N(4))-methyltransferase RsmH n=1 Tax=Leptolyngbya sp. AN02str TaxID=3423363 RepID=UPI003D3154A2
MNEQFSDEQASNPAQSLSQDLEQHQGRNEGQGKSRDDAPLEASTISVEEADYQHISVLPQEVVHGLMIRPEGHYLDATLGGGGHSRLILSADATVRVTALDQDERSLVAAGKNLAEFGDRVTFHHTNFAEFASGGQQFDGILADLGVSSHQFDTPERGFSFRYEAPLDMRMNQQQDETAADIINTWDEAELARIFYTYGEERLSRKMARRIVEKRPIETTTQLAEVIFYSVPPKYRYGRIHPATRVFQALRIAVNHELEVLERFLEQAPTWLKPGGRIAIISFHSLEDRLVKHRLKANPMLRIITKKPIEATEVEVASNVRSRSAKLRIAERRSDLDDE